MKHEETLGGDESIFYMIVLMVSQICTYLKIHQIVISINYYMFITRNNAAKIKKE